MSKKLFFGTMFLLGLSMLALSSCKTDDPTPKPVISNLEVGTAIGEEPNEMVEPWVVAGTKLHIEGEILADGKIKRIDIEFHKEDGSGSILELFYTTGKYIGVKNTTFHEHIDIPANFIPSTDYDLHFTVTDEAGQTTMEEVEGLEVRAAE
jgi:hypothetical protein